MKYLKNAVHSMKELPVSLRAALSNRSGEGYVDTAGKTLKARVRGALVLWCWLGCTPCLTTPLCPP